MAIQDKSNSEKDGENPDGANPEFENFQQLLKQVLSVPKEKINEQRAKRQQDKERKERAG